MEYTMTKKYGVLFFFIIIIVLLVNTGCKDFGVPDYNLIVNFGEGISGLPDAGSYKYKELSKINYKYIFLNEDDRAPSVFINESSSSYKASGTIVMYKNIEIYVGDVNIVGTWKLTITDNDGIKSNSNVEFIAGTTNIEGSFTDSRGYTGTWKNVGNRLFMSFKDWDGHIFEGNISPKYLVGNVIVGKKKLGSWSMVK
jgi:hypothetical protein